MNSATKAIDWETAAIRVATDPLRFYGSASQPLAARDRIVIMGHGTGIQGPMEWIDIQPDRRTTDVCARS